MTETFDLYVWHAPRVRDPDEAAALIQTWHARERTDDEAPAGEVFEASNDVQWFYNELVKDLPALDSSIDESQEHGTERWWSTNEPRPTDRLVKVSLGANAPREAMATIFSIAAKYDLVIYDPQTPTVFLAREELAAEASATFWRGGAIPAAVAGTIGLAAAVAAWLINIPILSGVVVVVGAFVFVLAIYAFIHGSRGAARSGPTR